jgi:hypothetical protein
MGLARYSEWLEHVFDRQATSNGWYFDEEDTGFDASETEIVALVAHTLENCGADLARYSDEQVNHGLKYIFETGCSDIVHALMSDAVPAGLRLQALSAIRILYRDCFGPRCAPVLGHLNAPGANPLNFICYMLWDVSPLSYWERKANPDRARFYDAVVDVLEDALTSSNPACVESALHGLGHLLSSHIEPVTRVIAAYLRKNIFVSPELKKYAQQAGVGNIQ